MTVRVNLAVSVLLCYLLGWLVSFLALVGFKPRLIPGYFAMGWSFNGFEVVSFVWYFAWPIFGALLLAYYFIRRRLKAPRKSVV
jgi:hypothetical protein